MTMSPARPRCRSRIAPYIPSYLEEGQKCVVCGDDATGLHYRAITCEGCKGFFRRVCQRGLQFTCKNNENCEINKTTRNVCQHCRLLKCFANGMSAELVLNEGERCAKRELIERNRERKELERVRAQILRHRIGSSTVLPSLSDEQSELVFRLTAAWCEHVEPPMQMGAEFERETSSEQFNLLIKEILRRSFCFASAVPLFSKMKPIEQECLLVKNRAWLEIQLLRLVHQIDPLDGSLLSHKSRSPVLVSSPLSNLSNFSSPSTSSPVSSLLTSLASSTSRLSLSSISLASVFSSPQSISSPDSGVSLGSPQNFYTRIVEIDIGSDGLLRNLLALADSFQKLELDNEQIAVLSAILIFQTEFLPNSEKTEEFGGELWSLMEVLMARNSAGMDTPQRIGAYPRVHAKLAQLRAVARRFITKFFESKNPQEFARLLA